MPRVTWAQNSFDGGEWSPLTYGRSDLQRYKSALATCLNYVSTAQGGLTRRPGTRYVANTKNNQLVRLVPFEFSVTQAYVLEFGAGYIRFYTNDGQLLAGGAQAYYPSGGVTFTVVGGLVNKTSHGLVDGTPVAFTSTGALPTGINSGVTYYVTNATANTFKVSATVGGTAITMSGTPTGSATVHRAYSPGDLISSSGVTYYCIAATYGNVPPNATYWLPQTDGIYEIPSPYTASDLADLSFVQSADVLFVTHKAYAPRKLSRFGPTNWTFTNHTINDGPYDRLNTTATTLTSSATTGTATLTASAVAGINGNTGFSANDVGRIVRLKVGSAWAWGTITAYTSSTVVTVSWQTTVGGTTASSMWRLGVWYGAEGVSASANYPAVVTFHQDRLTFAGSPNYPNRLDASNSSDYENFSPTQADGTVVDSNSLGFSFNSAKVNAIQWLRSDQSGLLAGTASGEWVVAPSTAQNALTPTNVTAKQVTSIGSANVTPLGVGKCTLYIQRTKRKVREMTSTYTLGGTSFDTPDISLISEHLTKTGIKQMAAQLAPHPVVWFVRNDGALVAMSYDKEASIIAWHQHSLGGYSDAAQTAPPIVESVATIPAPSTDRDQVWVSVQRFVNGATVRTIELLQKYWEDGDAMPDAFFVDCGATYSGGATTTVTGLTWLIGQTVSVLADGSVHPTCVVDNTGKITLQRSASKVQVGLGYASTGKTMRIEAGAADGSAQGKLKRIHRAVFRFFQSVGLNVQSTNGTAFPEPWRTSADKMDNPVALFTGDKRWAWDGSYELEGQVTWTQTDPLPSNVLMVVAQLETQDGG